MLCRKNCNISLQLYLISSNRLRIIFSFHFLPQTKNTTMHSENTIHTTIRSCDLLQDWRSTEVRKFFFLAYFHRSTLSQETLILQWECKTQTLIPLWHWQQQRKETISISVPQTGSLLPKNKLKIIGIFSEQEPWTPHSLKGNSFAFKKRILPSEWI